MILNEAEMIRWGKAIGAAARTPLFVLLRGPLGAGKSVLARSIAQGAGVEGGRPLADLQSHVSIPVEPGCPGRTYGSLPFV